MYFELRTTNLCNEWQGRNDTLSYNVKRIRLLGRGIPFSLIVWLERIQTSLLLDHLGRPAGWFVKYVLHKHFIHIWY